MGPYEMAHTIAGLSSGTVSRLCGSVSYEVIDRYTNGWVEWVVRQPSRKRWATWQECHEEFSNPLVQEN